MDFDSAARRLAKDHEKLKGKRSKMNMNMNTNTTSNSSFGQGRYRRTGVGVGGVGGGGLSMKAQREAELQKKEQLQRQARRQRERALERHQRQYMSNCQRLLHVKSLSLLRKDRDRDRDSAAASTSTSAQSQLTLQPTSIYGTGDKIALPPSVLEILSSNQFNNDDDDNASSPWTFRIGIRNPNYKFPASPLLQTYKRKRKPHISEDDNDMDRLESMEIDDDIISDSDNDDDDEDEDEDEDENGQYYAAYLDELRHQYIAYTHCTVVEFTQEEGHVGIPQAIASALLDTQNRLPLFTDIVPTTRTVDPSASHTTTPPTSTDNEQNQDTPMAMGDTTSSTPALEDPTIATPGHIAYGAFDIPDVPLEITLLRLPKGKGCTMVPTVKAIQAGFYNLKDIKLVLEQSLIRTRATLSKGDVVSTWHRGVQYDLTVTKIIPTAVEAVTCINTDIEVDIGETTMPDDPMTTGNGSADTKNSSTGHKLGTGRVLGSTTSASASAASSTPLQVPPVSQEINKDIHILPEPPIDEHKDDKDTTIGTIQIRFSDGKIGGKRRFDVTKALVHDLFAWVSSLSPTSLFISSPSATSTSTSTPAPSLSNFQLVTRFPRRVVSLTTTSQALTLQEANVLSSARQELFLIEMIP